MRRLNAGFQAQNAYTFSHCIARLLGNSPGVSFWAKGLHHMWQGDLVDMQAIQKENAGRRCLLTDIDAFSRQDFAKAIRTKKPEEIITAFSLILWEAGTKPKFLHSNLGTEFTNRKFWNWLDAKNIIHYTTHSITKSNVPWLKGGIGRWKSHVSLLHLQKHLTLFWKYYHSSWVPIIRESIGLWAWPPRTSPTRMRGFMGMAVPKLFWDNVERDIDIKSMTLWESQSWRRYFSGAMEKDGRRKFFKLWINFPHVHRRIN